MLIRNLRQLFSLTGSPNTLRTDQAPPFASAEMQEFLRAWGVEWRPSSPHHPRSNGHAEVMVKAVKHLLSKSGGNVESDAFRKGLLELRNTPGPEDVSPAQRVYGRQLRSLVPAMPEWYGSTAVEVIEEADVKKEERLEAKKAAFDASARALRDTC